MSGRTKITLAVIGMVLGIVLLCRPVKHLVYAARFALSLKEMAAGKDMKTTDVAESRLTRNSQGRVYEALCYRPTRHAASTAIILSAGISELGCRHPKLIALSRVLARQGVMVITPDIREFREFQITAAPIEQMVFWHGHVSGIEGGEKIRKIGLAGVSYSGTLALMAAARPQVRDTTAFVIAIGPYYNLTRCSREWFAAGSPDEWKGYHPTRFYARWVMLLAALDLLEAPSDRLHLRQVLGSLLQQKPIPAQPPDLTPEGRRWRLLATTRPGQSDAALASEIELFLTAKTYTQLDPRETIGRIQCPVFLIHGAYDDLIPPRESLELHENVGNSRLLISPFLTHTHPARTELSRSQQLEAIWNTLVFCRNLFGALL